MVSATFFRHRRIRLSPADEVAALLQCFRQVIYRPDARLGQMLRQALPGDSLTHDQVIAQDGALETCLRSDVPTSQRVLALFFAMLAQ